MQTSAPIAPADIDAGKQATHQEQVVARILAQLQASGGACQGCES
jgi:hypothetical protein